MTSFTPARAPNPEPVGEPMSTHPSLQMPFLLDRLDVRQRHIVDMARALSQALDLKAGVVGGIVRDLLLERPSDDLDLVLEGEAAHIEGLMEGLTQALGAHRVNHERFGTAVLTLPDGQHVDIATARLEHYAHPAELPTVEPGSLWQDLKRRDFTFNSLAIRIDHACWGELMDPFGGLDDLRSGLVRVLHMRSFIDDPTRIFRAVRFEQRLGFRLEAQTEGAVREAVEGGLIRQLTSERIRHEMALLLAEPTRALAMLRLQTLGLFPSLCLSPLIPEQRQVLELISTGIQMLERSQKAIPIAASVASPWQILLLAVLYPLSSAQLALALERMAIRGAVAGRLIQACISLEPTLKVLDAPGLAPSGQVERLERVPPEGWCLLWAVAQVRGLTTAASAIEAFVVSRRGVKAPLTGHELMALGVPPGPSLRHLLLQLRQKVLDEHLTRDQAFVWLKETR